MSLTFYCITPVCHLVQLHTHTKNEALNCPISQYTIYSRETILSIGCTTIAVVLLTNRTKRELDNLSSSCLLKKLGSIVRIRIDRHENAMIHTYIVSSAVAGRRCCFFSQYMNIAQTQQGYKRWLELVFGSTTEVLCVNWSGFKWHDELVRGTVIRHKCNKMFFLDRPCNTPNNAPVAVVLDALTPARATETMEAELSIPSSTASLTGATLKAYPDSGVKPNASNVRCPGVSDPS